MERTEPEITGADVEFYRRHGWWVCDDLFSGDEIDELVDAAERYWAGERDHALDLSHLGDHLDWRPGQGRELRLNDYAAQQLDAIGQVVLAPKVGRIAASLAESSEIRLFNSELIYKPPGPTVGWHVDKAYWPTCTSRNMLTAWIPLHDCPAEMGPLSVIDGSHLWPETEEIRRLRQGKTFLAPDAEQMMVELRRHAPDCSERQLALRRGQVSFHHCLTFHGSSPNLTDRPRLVVVLHLQDAQNRYEPAVENGGEPAEYKHDPIARKDERGLPDYADPLLCPRLWPTSLD